MSKYKIFTIEEFNQRVKMFWDLMIKQEFPEWECVEIQHDIQKRRTNNYGMAHYKNRKPNKLSFSYRMLDGRYILEAVDDVIKHEIGHHLDLLRLGKSSGHGAHFKKIAKEFGFDAQGIKSIERSEIYDICVRNESKYHLICGCGEKRMYKRKPWWVDDMVRRGHTKNVLNCKKCGKEDFTLYIFPNGIDTDSTEIDYEAYVNLTGGQIIR